MHYSGKFSRGDLGFVLNLRMYYGLVIALCISLQVLAQSNQASYKVYRTKEGTFNNTVLCMLKDSRGFTWTGTSEGLNRFDGHLFRHFFSDRNNANSLTDNYIWDILEYKPNRLLIATNNGASVLNTITNNFENEAIKIPGLGKYSYAGISSLFMDTEGKIWINHSGEIDVFDNNLVWQYRFTDLPWARPLKGIEIKHEEWYIDKKQRLCLPTIGKGLCIADLARKQLLYPGHNPSLYPFISNFAIRSFYYDEEKDIVWYAPWGAGLYKFNLRTGQLQQQLFGLPVADETRNINTIIRNESGQLVCGGSVNIYIVDTATLQYTILKSFDRKQKNIAAITRLKGRNDQIWLGGEGLIKIIYEPSLVKQFYFSDFGFVDAPDANATLAARDIIKVAENNYFFSYGLSGLIHFNLQTGNLVKHTLPGPDKGVYIGKMCLGINNDLWISTSSGFKKFDPKNLTWQEETSLNAAWSKNKIPVSPYGQRCMYSDKKGNIWIGVDGLGIARYNTTTRKFMYIPDYTKVVKGFFAEQFPIHRITEDEDGTIWFSSFHKGGILSYQPQTEKWELFPASEKQFGLLADKGINKIVPAGNHQLWLASNFSHGLMKYDYRNDSISFVDRSDGLLSDFIGMINKDDEGNVIISTDKGINYYNTRTKEVSALPLIQTGITWELLYVNCYDGQNNTLLYGMPDRILVIKKEFMNSNILPGKPVIDGLTVNNIPETISDHPQALHLDYTQKNININFAAVNYCDNTALEYTYKLEGFDKDWQTGHQHSSVAYSNLLPGNYRFLVKAKEQSGNWGPVNDELNFRIVAAFWQTSWFWIMVIVGLSGLTAWFVTNRIRGIRKKASLKQKIAETEIQALRAQMNPHFIFNCVSAIDNLVQTNQKEKATIYLGRFARLIRTVLDSLRHNTVPFEKDFESLKIYLQMEQFRCNNKFEFELTAAEELLQGDYKVPPLIVQPFVENAIQHGLLNMETGHRRLIVAAALQNGTIRYTITDNGVGRLRAAQLKEINKPEQQSFGIAITTERIHLHNQNGKNGLVITDLKEGEKATGTKVEVFVKTFEKN
jgi:ligand-binding sensor domain-containing protein